MIVRMPGHVFYLTELGKTELDHRAFWKRSLFQRVYLFETIITSHSLRDSRIGVPEEGCFDQGVVLRTFIAWFLWFLKIQEFIVSWFLCFPWFLWFPLGVRLRGRTTTCTSKKGSEKGSGEGFSEGFLGGGLPWV